MDVYFTFGSAPGGGEYLFPAFSKTNALGKATVTLNTGTIAGVVQIVAQATYNGKTIRSKPILIAIHGGFPDLGHFHVASPKLNYPALGIIGFLIDFTAYVGDKYSNPVRENTVVYFKTNSGIIVGSALTGSLGTGTVSLLTQPWPNDPIYGPGFFRVTATTVNEFSESISTETVRMQSGVPILSVSPTSFNIDNGGSQSFTFTLNDVNGNPMAEGQSADVKIESEFYKIAGSTSVKLPDTQSKSWTVFSFTAYDNKPDSVFVENISIEISTGGPNGSTKIAISGVGR